MKNRFTFIPFLLCFFTAALPPAAILSAGDLSRRGFLAAPAQLDPAALLEDVRLASRPGLLPVALTVAAGAGLGLVLFLLCTRNDRFPRYSRLAFLIAASALAGAFVLLLFSGADVSGEQTVSAGITFCSLFPAEAAAAFLLCFSLLFAEQSEESFLQAGLCAAAALAAAVLLAALITRLPLSAVSAAGLAACAALWITAFAAGKLLFPDAFTLREKKSAPDAADAVGKTREQRLQEFAELHRLTARETEVLCIVVDNDCALKEVAFDLKISERMVQRYMTSIYQKTGTQSRIGLSLKYFGEFKKK